MRSSTRCCCPGAGVRLPQRVAAGRADGGPGAAAGPSAQPGRGGRCLLGGPGPRGPGAPAAAGRGRPALDRPYDRPCAASPATRSACSPPRGPARPALSIRPDCPDCRWSRPMQPPPRNCFAPHSRRWRRESGDACLPKQGVAPWPAGTAGRVLDATRLAAHEALFASRLAQLPERAGELLLMAAPEGSGDLRLLWSAAGPGGGRAALARGEGQADRERRASGTGELVGSHCQRPDWL